MSSARSRLAFVALLCVGAGAARAPKRSTGTTTAAIPTSIGFANIDGTGGGAAQPRRRRRSTRRKGWPTTRSPTGSTSATNGGADGKIVTINLDGSGAAVVRRPRRRRSKIPRASSSIRSTRIDLLDTTPTLRRRSPGRSSTAARRDAEHRRRDRSTAPSRLDRRPGWRAPLLGQRRHGSISDLLRECQQHRRRRTLNITGGRQPERRQRPRGRPGCRAGSTGSTADRTAVSYASLNGTAAVTIAVAGRRLRRTVWPRLRSRPRTSLYWANYGKAENRNERIRLRPARRQRRAASTSPPRRVNGAAGPVAAEEPDAALARRPSPGTRKRRSQLSCSHGQLGAPTTPAPSSTRRRARFAYQWTLNGAADRRRDRRRRCTAAKPGAYACVVTATNQVGAAAQTSAAAPVESGESEADR